ncbi:MAG: hypothetical protein GKR77_01725 [Legionellales bacterium]|nr:hypothetical protein [Legionellales bacterium]
MNSLVKLDNSMYFISLLGGVMKRNMRSGNTSRRTFQGIKESLEDMPRDIFQSAKINSKLTDLCAYLETRLTKNGYFRKSFLINLNFYLMEELNRYLPTKLDDQYIANQNDIKEILRGILKILRLENIKSTGFGFGIKRDEYERVGDLEKTPVLMESLITRMRKFYCQRVVEVIDRSGNFDLIDDFFKKLDYPRIPWVPKINVTEGENGRVKVKHPLGSKSVSMTRLMDKGEVTDGEHGFFQTTVFMQQMGAGASHNFNPTNDQATQALGAWEIEGDRHHFVGATVSFGGFHAEEQLIRVFESEFKPGSKLQQAKESGEKIVLHLFISKSPCAERCTPMLEQFLKNYPSVEINFFLQQWYESNDPSRMLHHAKEFLITMRQFGDRVTYKNLPLATSAIELYQHYRDSRIAGSTVKNPFAPMPDGMVDAIYDLHISGSDLKLREDSCLAKKRSKIWQETHKIAQAHLSADDAHSAAAAAAPAAIAASSAASAYPAFDNAGDTPSVLGTDVASSVDADLPSVADTPSAQAVALPDVSRATNRYGIFSRPTVPVDARLAATLDFETANSGVASVDEQRAISDFEDDFAAMDLGTLKPGTS